MNDLSISVVIPVLNGAHTIGGTLDAIAKQSFRGRLTETIVEKTHVPYRLDAAKLARIKHVFFDEDWGKGPVQIPPYGRDVAANPFVAASRVRSSCRPSTLPA